MKKSFLKEYNWGLYSRKGVKVKEIFLKKINIFIRIANPECQLHKPFVLSEDFYVSEKP